jgi:hypothetical protein
LVMKAVAHFEPAFEFIFRTVGQIAVSYHDSTLSAGHAGKVRGGDRLPWAGPDVDNFAPLTEVGWQIHVYGEANDALVRWGEARKIPTHVFAWRETFEHAGLQRDALYLLRPDTYVALAEPRGSLKMLDAYFADRGIAP